MPVAVEGDAAAVPEDYRKSDSRCEDLAVSYEKVGSHSGCSGPYKPGRCRTKMSTINATLLMFASILSRFNNDGCR